MKECTFCKKEKENSFFHKNKSRKDGLNNICKSCRKKYHKKWYENNKKEYVVEKNKENRNNKKDWILNYLKENPCVDCGEDDIVVLEFDHQRDKFMEVGLMVTSGYSIKRIKEEISKCEVVCANCHRRRTSKQFNWYKQ